ncbi:MAG TPA: hypothetical protein VFA20_33600 [Myxococcaceae bacterium]|nr:hypothetical protein [Myxococcaceae bacterium]
MPRRLGDVRLRFDAELLIGECVPPLDVAALLPDALLLSGLAAGVVAAATVIAPGLRSMSVWGTMGATAACAAAILAGLKLRGRRRWRRGFVVNFDQHLVRVDQPRGLRTLSETTSLPFREVESLQVVDRGPGRCALELSARGRRFVLVDGVADDKREQLHTLRRLLQAAVGPALSPPASA